MALETLTRQTMSRTPAEFSYQNVTAAGGFKFPNDGHTFLVVNNDADAFVMTVTITKTLDGATATKTITVTASKIEFVGPFPTDIYNDTSDYVFITPDGDLATTYGVAVVSM